MRLRISDHVVGSSCVSDPCTECDAVTAIFYCEDGCDQKLCFRCDKWIHEHGTLRSHKRTQIRAACIMCHLQADVRCNTCEVMYCSACSGRIHANGKRKTHAWALLTEEEKLTVEHPTEAAEQDGEGQQPPNANPEEAARIAAEKQQAVLDAHKAAGELRMKDALAKQAERRAELVKQGEVAAEARRKKAAAMKAAGPNGKVRWEIRPCSIDL
jgi:hypothetical protein